MKFISWNVNGIRACLGKGFLEFFHQIDADFFCIQETKCQAGQVELSIEGYEQYWNYAQKKGILEQQSSRSTHHYLLSMEWARMILRMKAES